MSILRYTSAYFKFTMESDGSASDQPRTRSGRSCHWQHCQQIIADWICRII